MALSARTRLGPYEILASLGAGGMGVVYKAKDTRLGRTVALKVLAAHIATDADARERFEREARIVSSLNHPHICTLYDVGREDGIDFLVMESLEGQTLLERLTKGPLLLGEALRHAIELADALDKAHRQGVVHRDLKPGNIRPIPRNAIRFPQPFRHGPQTIGLRRPGLLVVPEAFLEGAPAVVAASDDGWRCGATRRAVGGAYLQRTSAASGDGRAVAAGRLSLSNVFW